MVSGNRTGSDNKADYEKNERANGRMGEWVKFHYSEELKGKSEECKS